VRRDRLVFSLRDLLKITMRVGGEVTTFVFRA